MAKNLEARTRTSKLAIVSLCCGILYPVFFCLMLWFSHLDIENPSDAVTTLGQISAICSLLMPFAAVILGHLARRKIFRSAETIEGARVAAVGAGLGYAWFAIWILVALGMPHVTPSRIAAREASAVGSLRAIHTSSHAYAAAHPEQGFPPTLGQLSRNNPTSSNTSWSLDPTLAIGEKYGYRFTYTPRSTHSDGKFDEFDVIAEPIKQGKTGVRCFFVDQTGTISFGNTRDTANRNPL